MSNTIHDGCFNFNFNLDYTDVEMTLVGNRDALYAQVCLITTGSPVVLQQFANASGRELVADTCTVHDTIIVFDCHTIMLFYVLRKDFNAFNAYIHSTCII